MAKYTIVCVRHGESEWNKQNLFTGWHDADLSETGIEEAKNAGKVLNSVSSVVDFYLTIVLKIISLMKYRGGQ
jgi:2,3-bisphosphoglycerate-dependent phosphoglycerate mutase